MIVLSFQDIEFMLAKLPLPPHLRRELEALKYEKEKAISDEAADDLRDLCTDRLDTHGFDINYMPTKEGEQLEKLVDKLFTG